MPIKIKCDEQVERTFSNLFDYEVDKCNKCFKYTETFIGFTQVLHFYTNSCFDLVKSFSKMVLKSTVIYVVKNEFLFEDLDVYSELDLERIIIIEELPCDFVK